MCECYLCSRDRKQELDIKRAFKRVVEVYGNINNQEVKDNKNLIALFEWTLKNGYLYQDCKSIDLLFRHDVRLGLDTISKMIAADVSLDYADLNMLRQKEKQL